VPFLLQSILPEFANNIPELTERHEATGQYTWVRPIFMNTQLPLKCRPLWQSTEQHIHNHASASGKKLESVHLSERTTLPSRHQQRKKSG